MKWFYIIYGVLFVLSVIYRLSHKRSKDQLEIINPPDKIGYDYISSFNGCGTSIVGKYPTELENQYVYYIVVTVLFIPILRLKCVLGKQKDDGIFHQEYEYYGELRPDPLEILCITIIRAGLFVAIYALSDLV